MDRQRLSDFYIHYHFLNFAKLYNNERASSEGSLTACRLHLQVRARCCWVTLFPSSIAMVTVTASSYCLGADSRHEDIADARPAMLLKVPLQQLKSANAHADHNGCDALFECGLRVKRNGRLTRQYHMRQVLEAMAQSPSQAVRRRFFQLRVMDYVTRELSLEMELASADPLKGHGSGASAAQSGRSSGLPTPSSLQVPLHNWHLLVVEPALRTAQRFPLGVQGRLFG